jgi:hypothetical protein
VKVLSTKPSRGSSMKKAERLTPEEVETAAREGRLDEIMWQLHGVSEQELRDAGGDKDVLRLLHQKMKPRGHASE